MRLFDAILDANQRALSGDKSAGVRPAEFPEALPVVVLTCIDPRLNRLMPEVLGAPEDQFIWLRNAGNIIFDSMSSMTRTLALACAVKGGREIAIIGHSDCKVAQTSVLELTDRFRDLGISRSQLPDNLNEFFGLFASERQNVMRGAEFVRQSPLIGPRVPVHGLLVDVHTGKLEWVVNGYERLQQASVQTAASAMPEFKPGEMKFPDVKIGDLHVPQAAPLETAEQATMPLSQQPAARAEAPHPAEPEEMPKQTGPREQKHKIPIPKFDPQALFKIVGADKKIYGPVSGAELAQWMSEGRVQLSTLIQKIGNKKWQQVAELLSRDLPQEIPMPPPLRRVFGKKPEDKS